VSSCGPRAADLNNDVVFGDQDLTGMLGGWGTAAADVPFLMLKSVG